MFRRLQRREFNFYKIKIDWIEDKLKASGITRNDDQDEYVSEHEDEDADYKYWQIFRQYEKRFNKADEDKLELMKDMIREFRAVDEE